MQKVRTQALVLRQQPKAENDQLFLLYTENRGKLLARAFGVAKMQRLTAGHLLPFLPVDILLQERQGRWTVEDARALQAQPPVSFEKIAKMQVLVQLLDSLLEYEIPDKALWLTMHDCTERLFTLDRPLIFGSCLMSVLRELGLMPGLTHCVVSGTSIDLAADELWWSSLAGGLVSAEFISQAPGTVPIKSRQTVKLLRILAGESALASQVRANDEVVVEAERLILSYIELLIQKNVKALPFIHTAR